MAACDLFILVATALVALVVDSCEDEDVKYEKGTTDRDCYPERRRICALREAGQARHELRLGAAVLL